MNREYTWQFRVRNYEIGANDTVRMLAYLNYMEEAAVAASDSFGYTREWYSENNRMWVVRRLQFRQFTAAIARDDLTLHTWLSEIRKVQCFREYELCRSDGTPVIRARHTWAFLNATTFAPERMPQALLDLPKPEGVLDPIDIAYADAQPIAQPRTYAAERKVEYDNLDANAHVNNAVYMQWSDQAILDLLRLSGWSISRIKAEQGSLNLVGHDVDYSLSAVEGDPIRITAQIVSAAPGHITAVCEIYNAETGSRLVRDRSSWQLAEPIRQDLVAWSSTG